MSDIAQPPGGDNRGNRSCLIVRHLSDRHQTGDSCVQSTCFTLEAETAARTTFRGTLKTYRFCDNVRSPLRLHPIVYVILRNTILCAVQVRVHQFASLMTCALEYHVQNDAHLPCSTTFKYIEHVQLQKTDSHHQTHLTTEQ